MSTTSRSYSDQELAALRQLYPTAPQADVLAALPGRAWAGIESAARRLYIRRKPLAPHAWTPAQEALLRAHYATQGGQYVAEHVGRTSIAVYRHAVKLGLKCARVLNRRKFGEREYTPAEKQVLTELYATAPQAEILAKLPRRSWDSIMNTTQRMGLRRAAPSRVWHTERLELLRTHYPDKGAHFVADLVGLPASAVWSAATRLGIKYVAQGKAPKAPKPPRVRKEKPAKVAKVKVVKEAKVKPPKPVKPIKEPIVRALPVPGVRERPVGTPNLNAQKARSLQAKQPRVVPVTADELKRLPYSHPGRMAYMRAAAQGGAAAQAAWQQWKQQAA